MRSIFTLCLIGLAISTFGQSEELNRLFKKAFELRNSPDSALYYAGRAYSLSQEVHYETGEQLSKLYAGIAFSNKHETDTSITLLYESLPWLSEFPFEDGLAHWYLGKINRRARSMESAEEHYALALSSFEKVDSTLFVGNIYSSLGVLQGIKGNYTEALELFTRAYELKINLDRENQASSELNNMALVYMRMQNYRKALELAHLSMELKDGTGNEYFGYSAIGGIYNLMGKPDSAIIFYEKELVAATMAGDTHSMANGYGNVGNIHYQNGNFKKALRYQISSLDIREPTDANIQGNYTEIGKIYRKLGKYDSAIYYLKKGLAISKEQGTKHWTKEASLFLAYLYADINRYDSGFHYLTEHLAYLDSIDGDRTRELFSDQRVRIETMKKQHEIDLLQEKSKLDAYQQKALIASAASVGVIALLFFVNYRSRQRVSHKKLNAEKDELKDELKRNQAQLSAHTLSMIHRKNGFDKIENELQSLEGGSKQKIKNIININQALEKDWDNFQNYFSQVHASFFEVLNRTYPDLSQSETRLCALIQMNLATKEIATLLSIEAKSVKMARYRLRKKLDLPEDADLNKFIQGLM